MRTLTNRPSIADAIKQRVTMPEIMTMCGIPVNHQGYASCPFHHERTASLRVYPDVRGWHCFGCQRGGSVIDFVMQFYEISFDAAVFKINYDFQLGIELNKKMGIRERIAMRAADKERQAERARQDAVILQAESDYWYAFDLLLTADRVIRWQAPQTIDEQWSDLFCHALTIRAYLIEKYKHTQTVLQLLNERGRSGGQRERNATSLS
jgi:DNA primase